MNSKLETEFITKRLTVPTIAVSDEKLQHFMDYLT